MCHVFQVLEYFSLHHEMLINDPVLSIVKELYEDVNFREALSDDNTGTLS
jgi:hypothetical protein